jgi:dolichol-phosphate mannosyltransferase
LERSPPNAGKENIVLVATFAPPALTVVVPCYNEIENVKEVVDRLEVVLEGIAWEVVFVDDDSPDGTAQEVRRIAQERPHVRVIQRIGRRGLSGACIEGILSCSSELVAVMDADLQHDETKLAEMFQRLNEDPALDLVVGSRKVSGGSATGGLSSLREAGSNAANAIARRFLKIEISDPMSGYFMIRRLRFNEVVLDLQKQGFKILADMIAASHGRWNILELPYEFRARAHGESKLDTAITLEFLGLIIARLTGGWLPIRFILFMAVGVSGLVVQIVVARLVLWLFKPEFVLAEAAGVFAAMTSNFLLNNGLTYRDRRLRGTELIRGILSFYLVSSVGAIANVAVASWVYGILPVLVLASFAGALLGAVWNFGASSIVTWRAR